MKKNKVHSVTNVVKNYTIKTILKSNAFLLFFFSFGFLFAQNPVKIMVDTTNIRIGEQITYKIIANKSSEKNTSNTVVFPKLILDSLQKVEVVEELKIDTTKTAFIKKYILTSFDSGRYFIPHQKVLLNNKKYLLDSLFINVATVKVDTTKQGLFPIKAVQKQPVIFDDYKNYLWIGLAILAILAFLVWYFIFRKKKEEVAETVIPPYQLAVERLSVLDAKKLWQNNKTKQYYIELTAILRSYLESEYNIPALESTTDELMESIKDFNKNNELNLTKDTIANLQKLLQEADLVKFAKFKPIQDDIELHRTATENIINNLKPEKVEVIDTSTIDVSKIVTEKPSKKKWSTKRIVIISILIIALLGMATLGYLGYKGYKFAKENVIGDSTEALLNGEWFTDSYGFPSVTIETPKILKSQNVTVPNNVKNFVSEMAVFVYESKLNAFQIVVSTSTYTNNVTEFNLEGSANGVIQNMKAKGIEFLSIEKEPFFANDTEGIKLLATYEDKNPITQKMQENSVIIVAFGSKKGVQTILINHLKDDENAQQIAERIINSIEIADEDVE